MVQIVGELDGVSEVSLDVESDDVVVPMPATKPASEPGLTMNSGKTAKPASTEPTVKPKVSALCKVKNLIGSGGKGRW